MNTKILIPSLAALVLTASVAVAQMPPPPAGAPQNNPMGTTMRGPMRGNRTPPTAAQMAARQTQMCADRQARSDAEMTYREERLSLTPAQKPLFDRWKAAMQSENTARQANCTKPRPAPGAAQRPTLPERNARMEEMLKTRLASLEKIAPAEEALYAALTPDQQRLFESRGRGPGMAMAGRFGRMRGRGPGGPGGFGPGGPGGPGPRG